MTSSFSDALTYALTLHADQLRKGTTVAIVDGCTDAETISRDASQVSQEHIERLRSVGFTDVQICDIALCAAFRCFVSRFFDAVGAGTEPAFLDSDAQFRGAMTVGRSV